MGGSPWPEQPAAEESCSGGGGISLFRNPRQRRIGDEGIRDEGIEGSLVRPVFLVQGGLASCFFWLRGRRLGFIFVTYDESFFGRGDLSWWRRDEKKPDEGGRLRRKKPDEAETTKSSLRSRESISISTIPYLKCIIATRWWQLIHLSSYFHILTGTQATTSNNLIEYQGKMGLNSSICISVPFSLFSNMVP